MWNLDEESAKNVIISLDWMDSLAFNLSSLQINKITM